VNVQRQGKNFPKHNNNNNLIEHIYYTRQQQYYYYYINEKASYSHHCLCRVDKQSILWYTDSKEKHCIKRHGV